MLLFRSGRFAHWSRFGCLLSILLSILISAAQVLAQSKGHKKKQSRVTATPGTSPGEQSLTNIPLPIGHEAKGVVLPDFDGEGHLRGRFEAGTAHRMDEGHVGFQQEKPAAKKEEKSSANQLFGGEGPTTTEIYADEAFFDSNKSMGIFSGRVKVTDPRFNLQSDKLTVFISKGENQGLERAIAEGDVGL